MKFEDLLPVGKKLHELTDDEIDEITSKCTREELEKIESQVRKSVRKTKSSKTVESERKKMEELNKLFLGVKS